MTTIYENVASLVTDAVADTAAAFSEFDFSPPPLNIPAVDFSSNISASLPNAPSYTPDGGPPVTDITGDLDRASYSAASAVIGSLTLPDLPTTLTYETPIGADALPDLDRPIRPGEAPQAGFVAVNDDAGLETVTAPTIAVGSPPALEPIPPLDFDAIGISKLAVEFPEPPSVPAVEELQTPDQLTVQLEPELLSALQHTLSGQDIMGVQDQLYRLATHDLRRGRADTERKLFAEHASRGNCEASGPLFEDLADLHYESRLQDGQSYEQGRDFLYEKAKDKLVTAVQQSIAIETANFAVHLSYASKLIEVFEINAQLHNTILNILIDLYTTQLTGVNAIISAYNSYIGAALAEYRAESATLEVAQAKLQSNRARVEMYQAQARTSGVRVNVYETDVEQAALPSEEFSIYVDGLLQNVDIVRTNLQGYQDALRAFTQGIQQDRAKIDAYGAQIRAEGSAADVYRENWDLYNAAQSALSGQNSAVAQFNRSSQQALESEINVFGRAAEQQRSYLRNLSVWIEQKRGAWADYSRGVSAVVGYMEGKNSAVVDLEEASVRVDLSRADFATTEQALDAQRAAAQANIDAGLQASSTTTYGALAQASYSIRDVSARLSASASDSDAKTFSSNATESNQYTRSYLYKKSQTL